MHTRPHEADDALLGTTVKRDPRALVRVDTPVPAVPDGVQFPWFRCTAVEMQTLSLFHTRRQFSLVTCHRICRKMYLLGYFGILILIKLIFITDTTSSKRLLIYHNSIPNQYTTPVYPTSKPHQYTQPVNHTSIPLPVNHTSIPPPVNHPSKPNQWTLSK